VPPTANGDEGACEALAAVPAPKGARDAPVPFEVLLVPDPKTPAEAPNAKAGAAADDADPEATPPDDPKPTPPVDAAPKLTPPVDADPKLMPPVDADPKLMPPVDADPKQMPPVDADPRDGPVAVAGWDAPKTGADAVVPAEVAPNWKPPAAAAPDVAPKEKMPTEGPEVPPVGAAEDVGPDGDGPCDAAVADPAWLAGNANAVVKGAPVPNWKPPGAAEDPAGAAPNVNACAVDGPAVEVAGADVEAAPGPNPKRLPPAGRCGSVAGVVWTPPVVAAVAAAVDVLVWGWDVTAGAAAVAGAPNEIEGGCDAGWSDNRRASATPAVPLVPACSPAGPSFRPSCCVPVAAAALAPPKLKVVAGAPALAPNVKVDVDAPDAAEAAPNMKELAAGAELDAGAGVDAGTAPDADANESGGARAAPRSSASASRAAGASMLRRASSPKRNRGGLSSGDGATPAVARATAASSGVASLAKLNEGR